MRAVDIYNGDNYTSTMTYVNSLSYGIKEATNDTKKKGFFQILFGVILIVGGILLSVFSAGIGAIGVGIQVISFGITQLSSGIKFENLVDLYENKYGGEISLEKALEDKDLVSLLKNRTGAPANPDDELQWFIDVLANITFDSGVNMNWRHGVSLEITDFLDNRSSGESLENMVTRVLSYAERKLTDYDPERDGGKSYIGYAKAEYYEINPDYERRNKEKVFFHLPIEYQYNEDQSFPNRVHYSEQSFQEELSDNYSTFLPNNYRDIETKSGKITDLFRIQNNLYIHTDEALWHLPQNIQERVTGDVVSFIGTGSFFAIPPRLIVDDDNGHSAGCSHKWATLKTPQGVFFVSEKEGVIYQFKTNSREGFGLIPISSIGLFHWFKENIPIKEISLVKNNPSNSNGSGFISVYDSKKERVIFTKVEKSDTIDNSWTVSFSLKRQQNAWISFHSYLPSFYFHIPNKFYSLNTRDFLDSKFAEHNIIGKYHHFYDTLHPFIVEYVSLSNPLITKIWDDIQLITIGKEYDATIEDFKEVEKTFNKLLIYNERQISGELTLQVKSRDPNYLNEQIENSNFVIMIDRNEANWSINDFRDHRNADKPLFNKNRRAIDNASNHYIDKIIHAEAINREKSWTELESFRGKYLILRFTNDIGNGELSLKINYSIEKQKTSFN